MMIVFGTALIAVVLWAAGMITFSIHFGKWFHVTGAKAFPLGLATYLIVTGYLFVVAGLISGK